MKFNKNYPHGTTPQTLIESVEGKVWECIISTAQVAKLQSEYIISNSIQRKEGIHIRVVSEKKPGMNAVIVQPTLEDAYLYATATKEGQE